MKKTSMWSSYFGTILNSFRYASCLRLAAVFVCGGLAATLTVKEAKAYDPAPVLKNLYGAKVAVLEVYRVKASNEGNFLNAMVASGPYNKLLTGFVNERILQSLPATNNGNIVFTTVARYMDATTADVVQGMRSQAVNPFLAEAPVRMQVSLVEHILGNWGWENGGKQMTISAVGYTNDRIFRENISSLSFFKAGYVGQVGMLEVFPEGTSLEDVRTAVTARPALSGASIFTIAGKKQYAVYSEFFHAPTTIKSSSFNYTQTATPEVVGGQAGVVVQNYVPR
jgi:hypothetical protein